MCYRSNMYASTIFIVFTLPLFAQDSVTLGLREQVEIEQPANHFFPDEFEYPSDRDAFILFGTTLTGTNLVLPQLPRRFSSTITNVSNKQMREKLVEYETWDGTQWVNVEKETFTYDPEGYLINYLYLRGDGIQWTWGYRLTYAYDGTGNRTLNHREDWSGDQWVNNYRFVSTYNMEGDLTENLREVWDGIQWVTSLNSYRYAYTYDNHENWLEQIVLVWEGSQWVNNRTTTFTYDTYGNKTQELVQIWTDSVWMNSVSSTYTYDLSGNQTEYLYEIWDSSQWVPSSRNVANFDGNDNKITSLYENWDGNQWVGDRRYTYTYYVNINRTERLKETWSADQWVKDQMYTYSFDVNGRQTEQIIENWDTVQWVVRSDSYRRTYIYDLNGNMIEFFKYDWDGTQWVSNDKYTFTYDAEGHVTGHLGVAWDGIQWVNSFRSTSTYTWFSPYAGFNVELNRGPYPLTVQFSDGSSPSFDGSALSSWQWDFNRDGVIDATEQNPTYIFTRPGSKDVTLIVSDGVTSDTSTFHGVIQVDFEETPWLTAVDDVPGDQGGQVFVHFYKISPDDTTSTSYRIERQEAEDWVAVDTVASTGVEMYTLAVSTSVDSSSTSGYETNFRVVATIGETSYIGAMMSGYSVDNLAPAAVSSVQASIEGSNLILSWQASSDNDVMGYHLFVEDETGGYSSGSSLSYTTDLTMSYGLPENAGEMVYVILSEDIHNNMGAPSLAIAVSTLGVEVVGALPEQYALHPAHPNPFNPVTTIEFDLPAVGYVSMVIYDMTGREVTRLVDGTMNAGYHSAIWNGRTATGQSVASGIYIYRLVAKSVASGERFIATEKMVLLK